MLEAVFPFSGSHHLQTKVCWNDQSVLCLGHAAYSNLIQIYQKLWSGATEVERQMSHRIPIFRDRTSPVPLMMQPSLLVQAKSFRYSTEIPRTLSLLEKCSNTDGIKQIHSNMLKTGLILDPVAVRRLLAVSASPITGDLCYARMIFDRITSPDTFMWNAMIRGCSDRDQPGGALILYIQMMDSSVPHNSHTFPFLLKSCTDPSSIGATLQIHNHIVKFGFGTEVFTLNSLIHAYAACGRKESARLIFDRSPGRDTVTWNSIIDAYVKSGEVEMAYQMFKEMPGKNVVSWTTMVSGFVSAGLNNEALRLFHEMQIEGIEPDAAALASALSACANLGAVEQGRYIHMYIERNKINMDSMLECGLIDMYAKSGDIEEARKVFKESKRKCVSVWTAMISGLAIHGQAREALHLYREMQRAGLRPNQVTFTAILSACGYAGLIEEGRALFTAMESVHGLSPSMEHYGCLVDLLGRAGFLEEVKEVIDTMPVKPNATILGSLLNACRVRGNLELGKEIGERLIEMDPGHGGRYVHAASIFSAARKWEEAAMVRERMKEKGIEKLPGCSSIAINGTIHEFFAGDGSHPCIEEIHRMWDRVSKRLGEEGYRPEIGSLHLDIDEDEKEIAISRHSEKLAIAFGLLTTERNATLRIFKNLRVCKDCHEVAKMVSKIYGREIVMRDKTRFHVFGNGVCSCGDYW